MAGKYALIIEDHAEIGEIYRFTLEGMGYETEQILDGKEALERLEDVRPDIIILDMNLPQVSGHYIYKSVRSSADFDETVVIISTANTIVANALADDVAPVDYILVKPVRPSDIQEIMQEIESR